jgi:hypothetical protein
MGTIELKGYKVTVVDDPKIIDFIPAGMEVFSLTNPKKRSYYLIAKNKEDVERWTDALMHQAMEGEKPEDDWDAMEAKRNELIAAKDKLRKRTSELRLAKTINQSNGIMSSEVLLGKVLGTGSYGTVYKGTVRSTPVAIKVLHHQEMTSEAYEDFISELEILSKLHHPSTPVELQKCSFGRTFLTFLGFCRHHPLFRRDSTAPHDHHRAHAGRSGASPLGQ